jgi:magnesium-transporting ATPase (P-type)
MSLGLKDKLREGIKEDVQYASDVEINVRMVSNDMEATAVYIARQAGILTGLDYNFDYDPEEGSTDPRVQSGA